LQRRAHFFLRRCVQVNGKLEVLVHASAGDRYASVGWLANFCFGFGPKGLGVRLNFNQLKTAAGGPVTSDNLFSPEAQLAADDAITFRLTLT
jgi:hypothetical protein